MRIFLPIKSNRNEGAELFVQMNASDPFMIKQNDLLQKNEAFFHIISDDSIVGLFIDAVAHSDDGGDPYMFMSKSFPGELDLPALKNVFENTGGYKYLIRERFRPSPKNCKINSVVVFNEERKVNSIIHIHMVSEPDQFGKWKIYNIERE